MSCTKDSCSMNSSAGKTVTQDDVKEFYGKRMPTTCDLTTPSQCSLKRAPMPKPVRQALKLVHEDITKRYYGCGLVIPESLEGTTILDLGSGAGQDCFVLSRLVGEEGKVTGLDMTDELLELARKYIPYHMETFGYTQPNMEFVKGYIENLRDAGLKDKSFDIVVSNCVICLSQDKKAVLKEAYRVLKDGGELYFSDMYADRDIPKERRNNAKLWNEGFASALWWQDMVRLAEEIGFVRPRLATAAKIIPGNEVKNAFGDVNYASVTYRLFKVPKEQHGPCRVTYHGCITGYEATYSLDYNHEFKTGEPVVVDGQVATILKHTRCASKYSFEDVDPKVAPEEQVHDLNPFNFIERSNN